MATVFLAFGNLIRDFGMPTAALQAKNLSHQQASNVFWVSTALSTAAAIVLTAFTPLVVAIYDEPRLWAVTPVMATTLVINGLQAQAQVQLARGGRYAALAVTDVASLTIGLTVGISGALAGWQHWAPVAQLVATSAALLVIRAIAAGWRPTRPRRGHGSRRLLRAGSELGFAQLLTFGADNSDTLLVGAVWGASPLGFYNRAFQLHRLPRSGLLDPLTPVVIPTLNRATDEGRRPTDVLLRAQFAISALLTWVFLVMAVTAPWLVPLVLGEQWGDSIDILRLLSIGGCFASFGTVSYWTFIIEGQTGQLLRLHLVTKPLVVGLVVAAAFISVEAVAFAYSLGLLLAWPINLVWLARCANQDSWAFFRTGLRVLGAAAVSFASSFALLSLIEVPDSVTGVAVGTALSSTIYCLSLALVPGGRAEIATAYRMLLSSFGRRRGPSGESARRVATS